MRRRKSARERERNGRRHPAPTCPRSRHLPWMPAGSPGREARRFRTRFLHAGEQRGNGGHQRLAVRAADCMQAGCKLPAGVAAIGHAGQTVPLARCWCAPQRRRRASCAVARSTGIVVAKSEPRCAPGRSLGSDEGRKARWGGGGGSGGGGDGGAVRRLEEAVAKALHFACRHDVP